MVRLFKWVWATYQTLSFWQWAMALPVGAGGLATIPVIGALGGWPIWIQALASAGVALAWLTLLTGIMRLLWTQQKPVVHGAGQHQEVREVGRDVNQYQAMRDINIYERTTVGESVSAPANLGMHIVGQRLSGIGNLEGGLGRPTLFLNQLVLQLDVTFVPHTVMQIGKLELRWGDKSKDVYGFVPRYVNGIETHTVQFIITDDSDGPRDQSAHVWALAGGLEYTSEPFVPSWGIGRDS